MSLKNTLTEIITHLPDWEKKALNEAQTRQVIILRILAELGFDIWQPFEVIAEETTSSNNYRPDFVIKLQRDCFVIEAKSLGKSLSDSDVEQAINYVNSKGLRWALLTNGKEWKFFDNDLRGAASQRLAFGFRLQDSEAIEYFENLLSAKIWRQENAAVLVADHIQAIKLYNKLAEEVRFSYTATLSGLRKAIEKELAGEERQLAEQYFDKIAEMLDIDITAISTLKLANAPVITSQPIESEILQHLRDKLIQQQQRSRHEKSGVGTLVVKIGEEVVLHGSWRQLHTALAELFIDLHRESELNLVDTKNLTSYHDSSYSDPLSNGKFILAHSRPSDHFKRVNKLLRMLNIPNQTVSVNYKEEHHLLPN